MLGDGVGETLTVTVLLLPKGLPTKVYPSESKAIAPSTSAAIVLLRSVGLFPSNNFIFN